MECFAEIGTQKYFTLDVWQDSEYASVGCSDLPEKLGFVCVNQIKLSITFVF